MAVWMTSPFKTDRLNVHEGRPTTGTNEQS